MYISQFKSSKRIQYQVLVVIAITLFANAIQLVSSNEQDENRLQNRQATLRLLVITMATDPNDEGFKRFNRSVEAYGLDLVVLGANEKWLGGRQRIDLFRKALAVYKSEQDLVLLIVHSSDLILNGDKRDLLSRLGKFKPRTRIVFAAESNCWPDSSLESKYPSPLAGGERFLDSSAFIGFAPDLWELINLSDDSSATSDDQLYFTKAYLNEEIRQRLAIELDHKAELFQSLQAKESEVELEFNPDSVKVKNTAYLTEPVVVHANGPSRVVLNSLGNYLGRSWTPKNGCRYCNASSTSLAQTKESELPIVLVGLFIEEPTPFLSDFLVNVQRLNYTRKRIHLFVHNSVEYHTTQVDTFLAKYGFQYASQQVVHSSINPMSELEARNFALDKCRQLNCDYYLALDSVARLELPETLSVLIESNRTIVAPLLSRPGKLWSNFWAAITKDGYYARSHDYVDLVRRNRVGIWNVPHIMNAYLIEGNFIRESLEGNTKLNLSYYDKDFARKPILTFTHQLRNSNVFQYMINTHEFGHLVDPTSYNLSNTHPDFYQLIDNMQDWERHYLHEDYYQLLDDNSTTEQPCQDVFWFPLVSDLFCTHLIEIMEAFGQWSSGTNHDPRIEGGYESVPTRDIHMRQVGLQEMWLAFLREYVMPVQLKEFIGYEHDPPRAELAFVVRYNPAEQPSLKPHHDSSTYTLNIALNTPNVDYEGGGCRFARYNCSVTESRKGWALMHPGRLTHYHEGLPVTKGTRYIMVSFVDP